MCIRDSRLHLATLTQAAQYTPDWRLGVGYEFEQRPDGLPGLTAAYGLKFAAPPRTMDLGLLYRALNAHQVEMCIRDSRKRAEHRPADNEMGATMKDSIRSR